jgi:hypothetical protein
VPAAATSDLNEAPPHPPIASQWAPPSPPLTRRRGTFERRRRGPRTRCVNAIAAGRHADDRLVAINLAIDVGARPPCSRGSCQQPFQQTSHRRCEATNNEADREDRTKLPDGPPRNVEFDAAGLHGNTSAFGWLGAPPPFGRSDQESWTGCCTRNGQSGKPLTTITLSVSCNPYTETPCASLAGKSTSS